MEMFRFILSALCILIGLIVFIVGITGIYQFKFVLNRMHAASMIDTTGILFIVLGLVISRDFDAISLKLLLIVAFLWITSPIASHLISKLEFMTDEKLNDEIENELSETKMKEGDENARDL